MKAKKVMCCVKKCDRYVTVHKHKLCHAHYMRLRRHNKVGSGKLRKRTLMRAYNSGR